MGSSRSCNSFAEMLVRRDHDFASAGFQEAKGGFDLWTHVAGRKMAFGVELLDLRNCRAANRSLSRLLVILVNEVGIGGNGEQVYAEVHSEQS